MKRISTATRVVDKFGAGKDGYTDGDVIGGVPATDLEAALFDNVQEEIASVIEASGIALNGATLNQLLLALRSAGVFTTPAQFDNTTKAATSAFVMRALGNNSALIGLAANTTLTAANAGQLISISTASAITLPLASTVPSGTSIEFVSQVAGASVVRQGANTINTGSSIVNSIALNAGDTLVVTSDGGNWYAKGGSAQLGYTGAFAASKIANGYQKLPGGLILQWGSGTTPAGGGLAFTLPIVFPNACLAVAGNGNSAGVTPAIVTFTTSPSVITAFVSNGSGAGVAIGVFFIAIGW